MEVHEVPQEANRTLAHRTAGRRGRKGRKEGPQGTLWNGESNLAAAK